MDGAKLPEKYTDYTIMKILNGILQINNNN